MRDNFGMTADGFAIRDENKRLRLRVSELEAQVMLLRDECSEETRYAALVEGGWYDFPRDLGKSVDTTVYGPLHPKHI